MRAHLLLTLAGLVLTQTVFSRALFAADPPAGGSPNAAVIYWQAFAAMPTLEGEQKTKFDAAIKTTTEPVTDALQPIVARYDTALREMHRAQGVTVCDWNLNYDDGPECLLPHLQKARELSRVALLRARLRFAAKATDDAVADVVAALKMARDCGSSPLLISRLVDIAVEQTATEVLAANLACLSPQQLDTLAAALKTLPATPTMSDCVRFEGRMFGDWMERFINAEAAKLNEPNAGGKIVAAMVAQAGGGNWTGKNLESVTVAELREWLRRLRADYAELAKIHALPPAERRGQRTEFEAQLATAPKSADASRTLSQLFAPAIGKAVDREDQFQVRQQLLRFAIQALRHGPEAIKGAAVPNHGPVEYRQTNGGFELRCQSGSADKPEVLLVGTAK